MTKFIMMVGLPASGKSTHAKELAVKENATVHSSDSIREELFGNENDNTDNDRVFKELHGRIKADLNNGKSVIYDATNINYKRRKAFLDELKKFDCKKICYLIATPYEKCLEQNKLRDRFVPEHAIRRMYLNFYIPQRYEGWDDIEIIYNTEGCEFSVGELFHGENGLNNINQDNPHHTLTIGAHCKKCADIIEDLTGIPQLVLSALYHDIGKRFTKEFKNAKGEDTDIAHYYQHHLVSAYESLFYLYKLPKQSLLNITNYIQWHMQPFFIVTEKAREKFIGLVGEEFYKNLLILHVADKNAR